MLTPPISNPGFLQHGDKIWTHARTAGINRHYGIWDAEREMVLHNTHPGGVQYASFDDFRNREVFVEKRAAPGWSHVVVARARQHLGKPYHLVNFNCEHYVNMVHEGKRESPQLQRATWGAIILGIVGRAIWSETTGPVYNRSSERYHDRRTGRFVARSGPLGLW